MYDFLIRSEFLPDQVFSLVGKHPAPIVVDFILEVYQLKDDEALSQAFLSIIQTGDVEFMKKFLHKYPVQISGDEDSFFHVEASKAPNKEMMVFLMNTYPITNQLVINELFALALEKTNLDVMKLCLTNSSVQADIHLRDDYALIMASQYGRLDIVKYLLTASELKEHANITVNENEPLIIATMNGHNEVVEYLLASPDLKEHADIHADEDRALYNAMEDNNLELVKFLLSSPDLKEHANVHARNNVAFQIAEDYFRGDESDTPCPDMLRYLILEYGLKQTSEIKSLYKNSSAKTEIDKLFEERQVFEKLSQLPERNEVKRPKI